jgi:cell division protein YceG involved in septum cleavage
VGAPDQTDALYFVLRPGDSGAHEFSSNIAAHEAAADRFRRASKRKR